MEKSIYIKLLEEGTLVYRPVQAVQLKQNIYELKGQDIYNPEDEIWEFIPGTQVLVEEQELDGKIVLIALKEESS